MGCIITMKKASRDAMNQASKSGTEQFINSIKPIYAIDNRGNAVHIGTCLFIEWKSRNYLLTAAHILDDDSNCTFHLGLDSSFIPIKGVFTCTAPPNGNRNNDYYDFAWLLITPSTFPNKEQFVFIPEQHVVPKNQSNEKSFYLALGYPNSQNKFNPVTKSFTPRYINYAANLKVMPELCKKMGVTGRDHLFLSYDKNHSKDSEGSIVDSSEPRGCSGGALIDMGRFTPSSIKSGHEPKGRLAGMLIENKKSSGVLVAVKIDFILEKIDQSTAM